MVEMTSTRFFSMWVNCYIITKKKQKKLGFNPSGLRPPPLKTGEEFYCTPSAAQHRTKQSIPIIATKRDVSTTVDMTSTFFFSMWVNYYITT